MLLKERWHIMIPFNKPYYTGNEIHYILDAMSRNKLSGDGYYTKLVNAFIEERFNTPKALFVNSCSAALDMAALILDLKPNDEVILPSYTFVSAANSIMLRGAKPIFADVTPYNMNIDPIDIQKKITPQTKSIWVMHYAGVSCDMDEIVTIANSNNLTVVEDAAQGVYSSYREQALGTIGQIGCYSFHETKNYSSGEGGALLLNDPTLIERAEIIREKGTNRSQFYRGEIDKYSWVDIGSSYLGSDLQAAYLYAQLEQLEQIDLKRQFVFNYYQEHLHILERKGCLMIPKIPDHLNINHHMFYILTQDEMTRDKLLNFLKSNNIHAAFHYVPLHISKMGYQLGYKKGDLPITEEYAARLLRLPMYPELTEYELQKVVTCIKDFYDKAQV